ncbi:MAG TPA: DUF3455 domain-containing protein [Burkholderiaceae bacterium]|jgi:hypothetical protein|nr:DUF3455 domain-containing protein [Burkholderiaceae bacterium]
MRANSTASEVVVLSLCALAVAGTISGCASSSPRVVPPEVPTALRVPAEQTAFFEARAAGVQIYECAERADRPGAPQWVLLSPEATLVDASGRHAGKHYAGPTWESIDGSKVAGEARAQEPSPDPSAIAWVLLNAKSTSGTGLFAKTTSIQRVNTKGGRTPTQPCTTQSLRQTVRVPYSATYVFYQPAH